MQTTSTFKWQYVLQKVFFKYNVLAKDTNNSTFKNINNILPFIHSTLLQKYNLRLFNYMHL